MEIPIAVKNGRDQCVNAIRQTGVFIFNEAESIVPSDVSNVTELNVSITLKPDSLVTMNVSAEMFPLIVNEEDMEDGI